MRGGRVPSSAPLPAPIALCQRRARAASTLPARGSPREEPAVRARPFPYAAGRIVQNATAVPKQKCFLIRLSLILTVLFFDKDVTGAALSNEDLTKAFRQLEVKFEADQTKYESTISILQNELESFKNQSSKWIEEEQKSNNETKIVVDRLDKMSRIGTSCSSIASLGNIVSGNYFLDTDGKGNHAPYEVSILIS